MRPSCGRVNAGEAPIDLSTEGGFSNLARFLVVTLNRCRGAADSQKGAGARTVTGRSLEHQMTTVFRSLRRMPHCMRKAPGDALQISEYPVAPFGMEPRQRSGEIAVVINVRAIIGVGHWQSCPAVGRPEYWSYLGRVLEAFQGVCRGQYRRTWRLALHKIPNSIGAEHAQETQK